MQQSVKAKLLIPLIMIFGVSLITLVSLNHYQMRSAILSQEQVSFRNIESIVRNDLEATFTSTRMGLTSVINMPEVQQAFARRDREELQRLTAPIFEQAKKDGIEQFQFHLPPATSFLRLHQPQKYGDDLSSFRATVVQSNQEKKLVAGLEEGRGGYGFRVVAPVFFQGQHVGSAEYGMGFSPTILERWKEQCGGDFYMYPFASSEVAWQRVDKSKPLVGTAKEDPLKIDENEIKKAMSSKGVYASYVNGDNHAILIIPVYDYSGKPISYVKANLDRTEVLNKLDTVLRDSIVHLLLSLLIISLIMYWLITITLKPLQRISDNMTTVASGDLTKKLQLQGNDEISKLGQSFNTMLKDFRRLIGETRYITGELTKSSKALSMVTEETSVSVEEATEQVEKLAYSLQELDTMAKHAADYSQQAAGAAEEGQQVVQQAVKQIQILDSMVEGLSQETGGLGQKIEDVNKFVQLISEIAEQTNLLALNAAIESARAGEHGRGFSVVAQEVRKLADRSNQAAKDVKNIIIEITEQSENVMFNMNEGLKEVHASHQLINESGVKFKRIKELVELMAQQSQAVAVSGSQATASSSEISAAIQEQAASIQQVATSAGVLDQMAEDLKQQLSRFKSS
ncbi:methyl-accepting chemotaxis sensory transducer [Desulforamulus reducens MI-1]|uniref:Methyl-accepting chemotaxis sensory transducer n=1 Tax=Desulforamulus reducens (strain ATCC BAA-1160 / DSM 100696 / MI-1) TaxID=349161 RepID=A4J7B8_DESRM|nr:methyl-accepting chemotaxis protein [Desulforamulus reducens]ABO50971.1 methyl-accepting chemotaxis sensory transducer [Desulforamulus reducens MI-1]